MWWIPLGITNGNTTLIAERLSIYYKLHLNVWYPGMWATFFAYLLIIVVFLAFKKQREFPSVLLPAIYVVGAIHPLREIFKGSPIPFIAEKYLWSPGVPECYLLYEWVTWVEAATYVLLVSLAIIIYKDIRKDDLSYNSNKRLAYAVFAAFVIYPIVYVYIVKTVISIEGVAIIGLSCAPVGIAPSAISIVHSIIVALILLIIAGLSLKTPLYSQVDGFYTRNIYIWHVIKDAKRTSKVGVNEKAWKAIKSIVVIFFLIQIRITFSTYYFLIAYYGHLTAPAFWIGFLGVLLGYFGSVLALIWANRGLCELVCKKQTQEDKSLSMKLISN